MSRNILEIDMDILNVSKSTDMIIHLLHDYIAPRCFREARDTLYEAMIKDGTELTTKTMRKEYEAWKNLNLDIKI